MSSFGMNPNAHAMRYGAMNPAIPQGAYGQVPGSTFGGGFGVAVPNPGYAGFVGGGGFASFLGGGAPWGGVDASFGTEAFPVQSPERFVNSSAGGVVLDGDGTPTGRIEAGSFVDATTGKVYGTDGKQITIPSGSSVDFFDLPSIDEITGQYASDLALFRSVTGGGGGAPGKGGEVPASKGWLPSDVAGQWGPGGVTDLKGGGVPADACDHDHGASGTKQVSGTSASGGGDTAVAGAAGGGDAAAAAAGTGAPSATAGVSLVGALAPAIQRLSALLQSQLANFAGAGSGFGVPSGVAGTWGGGPGQAISGTGGLGTTPSLEQSLNELVLTLRDLVSELQNGPVRGGGGGERPWHRGRPGQHPGLPGQVGKPLPVAEPSAPPSDSKAPATDSSPSSTDTTADASDDSSGSTSTDSGSSGDSTSTSTDDGTTAT